MLSKEQVLEIMAYCDDHGVQRKVRLRELGITEWNFYKSRRQCLRQEKRKDKCRVALRSDEKSVSHVQSQRQYSLLALNRAFPKVRTSCSYFVKLHNT